jgi:hypothetical protein
MNNPSHQAAIYCFTIGFLMMALLFVTSTLGTLFLVSLAGYLLWRLFSLKNNG